MNKLWQKDYELNELVHEFTTRDDRVWDQQLLPYDCTASIAHAKTLQRAGILTAAEAQAITAELETLLRDIADGAFVLGAEDEDCHTAIENRLTSELGETGQKIHTARSRNDQVLTALRLFYRDALNEIQECTQALRDQLNHMGREWAGIAMPGYTHTRKAMPTTAGLWIGAFAAALDDDLVLLESVRTLINKSPAGSGAGYGIPMDFDRQFMADSLGFDGVQDNPIYCQLSRGKYETLILNVLGHIMLDINRLAADLIWFTMPQFGYFTLPDEYCTGSSIMPQKRNPDVLEIVRANYHQVTALQLQVCNTVSNLTSGYHRDLQITKAATMLAFQVTRQTVIMMLEVARAIQVNEAACASDLTSDLYATERVYELVQEGVPFRQAYQQVARQYATGSSD